MPSNSDIFKENWLCLCHPTRARNWLETISSILIKRNGIKQTTRRGRKGLDNNKDRRRASGVKQTDQISSYRTGSFWSCLKLKENWVDQPDLSMRAATMFAFYYSSTIKTSSHCSPFPPSSLHSLYSSSFPLRLKFRNFVSLKEWSFPRNSISTKRRNLFVVSGSKTDDGSLDSSIQVRSNFSHLSLYARAVRGTHMIIDLLFFFSPLFFWIYYLLYRCECIALLCS